MTTSRGPSQITAQILSCGVVPVYRKTAEPEFLLLRVYNYWDFPKGIVEKGEDPFDAARRELQEETGLHEVSFPWGNDFLETPPYARGKVARYYVGEVNSQVVQLLPNPATQKLEHQEYRWVTYKEARALLVPRVQQVIDWAYKKLDV